MQNYLEKVKLIYELYRDGGTEIAFYFIIMIILLMISKNERFRSYILYPVLVELIFIFNPVSILVFVNTGLLAENRYVRLFWLVQVAVIVAGAGCECIQRADKKSKKAGTVMALLLVGILILTGNYMFTEDNFQTASNVYKLPEGVIEVTDAIREDCESDGRSLSDVKIAVPATLSPYIRQYDGAVKMLYGRNIESNLASSTVQRLMQEEELNIQGITLYAKEGLCDYIVLQEEKPQTEDPEEYGYELVDCVKGYLIYRDDTLNKEELHMLEE